MFNTSSTSGHANVTNIGRIDDATAAGTYGKVASIDECLRVVHDEKSIKETLSWIAASDPSANYVAARGKHQSGTGIWFEQRADFKQWKDSPGTILCIYGPPGSGKTILSSSIITDVKALCEKSPLSGYAYFFFDSRSAEKSLLFYDNLIRSILTQLSYRCNGIPAALQDLYFKHGNGREQPSLESLHETLQRVIEGFDHVYIVIDSLDECGDRSELLNWITTLDIWRCPNLHLLLTSRPEPDIRHYLEGLTDLRRVIIEGSLSQRDIEIYLDARLAKITHWSRATREAVKKKLMESADGMFRWVALQLDDLERCFNPREIKAQLDALPKDLEETYERILARNPRRRDLLQLLHWLAFSVRALSLEEFAEIVSVDLEAEGHPSFDAELRYEGSAMALTVCAGMVTVTDGQVKLAHFSVKEYLISKHIRTGPAVYEQISHSTIAQTCLAYLLVLDKYESLTQLALASFPLAFYAAEHWPIHFRAAQDSSHSNFHDLLLSLFNVDSTSSYVMVNWVRLDDPDRAHYEHPYQVFDRPVKDIDDPIYYASLLNLTQVVDCLLKKGARADCLGKRGTVLQAASFHGGLEVTKLLLESGANVNAAAEAEAEAGYGNYGMALQAASQNGHLDVAKLLLERGAEVNARGGFYGTALQAASHNGHLDVAKLLFESAAEVNAQGGYYGTALQAASHNGHLDVAKLLLERGAEVNGGFYGTALQVASHNGHFDVAKLLLENAAEVNAQGGYYGTALQPASRNGHLDIAKLLLNSGAEVNANGGHYGTALQAASLYGHLDIAKLLLNSGAEVNAQGGHYGTALQAASHNGHLDVAKLLLESAAEVNAQGGHYGTALQAASHNGHLDVAKLLLESGADESLLVHDAVETDEYTSSAAEDESEEGYMNQSEL